MVTVRPPASEAHYHNPKSDDLFHAAIEFLGQKPEVRTVLLPRNERQAASIRNEWPELIKSGKVIIPHHVVDGLNLLWFSDLAISGGGTMNREAAALGVPVYSIFRGAIGGVDRYLSESGRLVLIEKVEDLSSKISLRRWERPEAPARTQDYTLVRDRGNVVSILSRNTRQCPGLLDEDNKGCPMWPYSRYAKVPGGTRAIGSSMACHGSMARSFLSPSANDSGTEALKQK